MRVSSVQDLNIGDVLGRSLYLPNNQLLLGAGFRINDPIKNKLIDKGYSHVYILEEGTEEILPEDVISEEIRIEAKNRLVNKVDQIKDALNFSEMSKAKVLESLEKGNLKYIQINEDMKALIKEILNEISITGAKFMNTIMIKSKDSFFFDHALNTSVLAILIGKKYKLVMHELVNLAMGAFLHDIGKVIIEEIDKKSGGSSRENYYKEHPTFGYLLLSNDVNISPLVLQTVNQHHEQQDGKGFPIGLHGDNSPPIKNSTPERGMIFRFAEICSVANAYDQLLMNPLKGNKMGPPDVISELLKKAGTVYNKHIVETLSQIVPIFPVGSFVRINNIIDPALIGSYGVVAKVNEKDFSRPTIILTANKYKKKIKPIIIDTSKLNQIELSLML